MLDAFLRDYVRSHIQLVSILPDAFEPEHAPRGRWFGEDWQGATQWATAENEAGRNLYWTLNYVTPGLNKKPRKTDIIGIRGFGVDIDPPKDGSAWDAATALDDLIKRGQPSYVISTGRGLQGVWLTTDTSVTHETVETVNRGLSAGFNGDATHNVDRLFRLPGLINHGDAKKRTAGYVPARATLAAAYNGRTYVAGDILPYFPAPAPLVTVEALPDGPDPRWTLAGVPDDTIIKMMLAERPSLAASFGEGATVRDMWDGTEKALEQYNGDASALDMALIAKIAFYFGNNPSKIEEIFSRSALGKRDKWQRQDYRSMTIGKVVANGGAVYSVPQRTEQPAPTQLPGVTTDTPAALSGEVLPSGEVMMLHDQINYFKGCVYVADLNEVLTPTGAFMKPATFKSMYGGYTFEVGTESFDKSAFIAFTENRLTRFPRVLTTMFEPSLPFGTIQDDAVNIYRPDPSVKCVEGDVSPFLNHLALMIPDERDRRILLTWMAALVQNPGAKFQWAPFLQGAQGNGKSMIGQVLKRAVGPLYVHEPFSDDLCNKFNDWQENKRLITVEELSLGEKAEMMNNLKTWITSDHIEMQAKGGKKSMRPNKANWIIFSNYQNGLVFTTADRRYAIFFTAQQTAEDVIRAGMSGRYFPDLWNWLREGGYAHMTWFLSTYQLDPEFSPIGYGPGAARAPETTSTGAAVTASMGRYEAAIVEAVESGEIGFRGGWISSWVLSKLEKDLGLRLNPLKRKSALESLGYVSWGRSTTVVLMESGTKPTLYCKRGLEGLGVVEYERAQGYVI